MADCEITENIGASRESAGGTSRPQALPGPSLEVRAFLEHESEAFLRRSRTQNRWKGRSG